MKVSWLLKSSTKSTLLTIFLTVLISACSSENSAAAAHSNANKNGINNSNKNKETNANQPASISGTDTGSVTEDLDENGDGLLGAKGKLNITDNDANEAVFAAGTNTSNYGNITIDSAGNWNYGAHNSLAAIQGLNKSETLTDYATISSVDGTTHTVTITINGTDETNNSSGGDTGSNDTEPDATEDSTTDTSTPPSDTSETDTTTPEPNNAAVISGINTGSVTEDLDSNNDGLLGASGKLNITDSDAGEAAFIAETVNSTYGSITIENTGDWFYGAINTLDAIQNLNTNETLTDRATVRSIDGTTHTVTITIKGVDDSATDSAAVIGGTDSGSVTANDDPDGDNLLEVSGILTITDSDAGEAAFIAETINSSYGNLIIDSTGNWNYAASNDQSIIQNLSSTDTLTERLTISSVDGTTHAVVITIFGTNEIDGTTADVSLTWVAPSEREDNSAISLSEIAGYKIYYSTTKGSYNSSVNIDDSTAQGYTFTNFQAGTYYFVITTLDTDGRESQYSSEVTIII